MYGAAVLDACEQLKARMKPVARKHPHYTFTEVSFSHLSLSQWSPLTGIKLDHDDSFTISY